MAGNKWRDSVKCSFYRKPHVSGTFKANSELLEFAVRNFYAMHMQHSKEGSEIIVDTGEIDEHFYIKLLTTVKGFRMRSGTESSNHSLPL
jgi:hypothetical protein